MGASTLASTSVNDHNRVCRCIARPYALWKALTVYEYVSRVDVHTCWNLMQTEAAEYTTAVLGIRFQQV
eukprot:427610-Prorocentrum_minimum.AAC.2